MARMYRLSRKLIGPTIIALPLSKFKSLVSSPNFKVDNLLDSDVNLTTINMAISTGTIEQTTRNIIERTEFTISNVD